LLPTPRTPSPDVLGQLLAALGTVSSLIEVRIGDEEADDPHLGFPLVQDG
jgi:hypothetical protein